MSTWCFLLRPPWQHPSLPVQGLFQTLTLALDIDIKWRGRHMDVPCQIETVASLECQAGHQNGMQSRHVQGKCHCKPAPHPPTSQTLSKQPSKVPDHADVNNKQHCPDWNPVFSMWVKLWPFLHCPSPLAWANCSIQGKRSHYTELGKGVSIPPWIGNPYFAGHSKPWTIPSHQCLGAKCTHRSSPTWWKGSISWGGVHNMLTW